jgi:hypothetical protein
MLVTVGIVLNKWFKRQVQAVVDDSMTVMLRRQGEFETRTSNHLNWQDQKLLRIERKIGQAQP